MSVNDTVNQWLSKLDSALKSRDLKAATDLFAEESYWRDFLSFTWNLKTLEGRDEISNMLEATLDTVQPKNWTLKGDASKTETDGTIEGWIRFETISTRGEGHLRINSNGQAYTLFTAAHELIGHEEAKGPTRPKGVEHGIHKNRKSWLENKLDEEANLGYTKQPYVVIIGGGQGGIGLGARLRRLGVPTIIIEKNERSGDSWRNRYKVCFIFKHHRISQVSLILLLSFTVIAIVIAVLLFPIAVANVAYRYTAIVD
jgi:putative flavoprotein involved in K+ transport